MRDAYLLDEQMTRIKKGERVLTAVEGGFALKPAPANGWMLSGHRFITDAEVFEISDGIAKEVYDEDRAWNMGLGEK